MDELARSAYDDWQSLICGAEEGDQRCLAFLPLLRAVAADEAARRTFPHFSMWALCCSRCPDYPFDRIAEVEWDEGCFRLDDGPPLELAQVLEGLLPQLRQATVYRGGLKLESSTESSF